MLSARRLVEPTRTYTPASEPRRVIWWGRFALGWISINRSCVFRHGRMSIEGISLGVMLSPIKFASRSSSDRTFLTPRTLLVPSSMPITMRPPEVFANATRVRSTPSGEVRSRLNSSVLPSCLLRISTTFITLHFTRKEVWVQCFRVAGP